MKSLYRRYRPVKLADVVGQEQVTESLANALKQGKIGHAYLFVGPRGCGKTSVARILAHAVNGFDYEIEDDYVDIIEIDGASNRGIDNIRELREKVMIAPTTGKYKVYIIDEVHMLTKEAFNALLKTLEEPPAHAIFIMATTDAYKVPVTITSRAQTYTFKLAEPAVMQKHLHVIAKQEGINIADDALELIVRRGGGSFRDSLSLLDQISTLSDGEINKAMVIAAMGLPEDAKITELLRGYNGGDVVKITTILKELLEGGTKAETIAEEMIRQIVAEPRAELMPLLAKLPEVKAPYAEARLLVAVAGPGTIARAAAKPSAPSIEGQTAGAETRAPERTNREAPSKKVAPATVPTTATTTLTPPAKASTSAFDWDGFLSKIRVKESGLYMKLMRAQHAISTDGLELYPNSRPTYNYLCKDHVKAALVEAAGVKVNIHEVGERPENAKKDETIDRISAIMGGEVRNDGGGTPF